MEYVAIDMPAPDFEIEDFKGQTVKLSDYRHKKNVILVLNRGFT